MHHRTGMPSDRETIPTKRDHARIFASKANRGNQYAPSSTSAGIFTIFIKNRALIVFSVLSDISLSKRFSIAKKNEETRVRVIQVILLEIIYKTIFLNMTV